jgi:hypothetical protein
MKNALIVAAVFMLFVLPVNSHGCDTSLCVPSVAASGVAFVVSDGMCEATVLARAQPIRGAARVVCRSAGCAVRAAAGVTRVAVKTTSVVAGTAVKATAGVTRVAAKTVAGTAKVATGVTKAAVKTAVAPARCINRDCR